MEARAIQTALRGALHAPSAHNAQPWRLIDRGGDEFVLRYAFADRLLADPNDRDGIMAMGGFYETLSLSAEHAGLRTRFEPIMATHPNGIDVGVVYFEQRDEPESELASSVARRQCNRNAYSPLPLPAALCRALEDLGNLLLRPSHIAGLVALASVMAWKDRRFVSDLRQWTRFDDRSPDGMTSTACASARSTSWRSRWHCVSARFRLGWLASTRSATSDSQTPVGLWRC